MHERLAFLVICVGVAATSIAAAQSGGQADPRALAKAQHMLRQASSERDALQAENAKLKAEVDGLSKKLGSARSGADKSRAANAGLTEKLQETAQTLVQAQVERKKLEDTNAAQVKQIENCVAKNVQLYQVNRELLQQYEGKGVMASLLQKEPLTGLKQVEIENLVEEYRDKIDGLRVKNEAARPKAKTDSAEP